ncbi:class I SAM-dependent DNA methyltransferase [Actinopolymorpha cephalotaxi]|uniref:SAM-dependent methyltransferase n=1 Tax=Actinopolymorpha cephalotaxi TaxID=504797 RepID=A0ABX2S127_9ACTN|nr:class I SAM-dependent methyltransferase [Actinopolymorpha cephalotaxi]NYH83289.1 SAM-dependent methyltransferase [Actinopolymorpha cephalotaxi]
MRADRAAAQARAFDLIGAHYDEVFPHKEGQREAGDWLAARLRPGAPVLDVGCGTGRPTARQLTDAGLRVTGIDISERMLELAREAVPEATFHRADVTDLDGSWGPYAGAVAFFSLLMLPRAEVAATLRLLHALLEPGGHLALAMVEADLDDVELSFLGTPVRLTGYPRADLRAVVEDAGFEVLEVRDHTYAPASTEADPETQLFVYARRG